MTPARFDRLLAAPPLPPGWTGKVHACARLAEAVAARYAGSRPDVLRLAIPPRHATVDALIARQARQHAAAPPRATAATRVAGARAGRA